MGNRDTEAASARRRGWWAAAGVRVIRLPSGVMPSGGPKDVNDCCQRLFADRNSYNGRGRGQESLASFDDRHSQFVIGFEPRDLGAYQVWQIGVRFARLFACVPCAA